MLIEAMKFQGLPDKHIKLIQALYQDPSFSVSIEGKQSQQYTQETGIRQGCPLSPYLFILCMDAIFTLIQDELDQLPNLKGIKGLNLDFNNLLYADDTLIIAGDKRTAEAILHRIKNSQGHLD